MAYRAKISDRRSWRAGCRWVCGSAAADVPAEPIRCIARVRLGCTSKWEARRGSYGERAHLRVASSQDEG